MTDTKKPQKVRLSKTNLDKLKAADGKRRIVWDSSIQGYGVRIMPSGGKTLETPPRAWGRHLADRAGCRQTGNTPTSVGKTILYFNCQ